MSSATQTKNITTHMVAFIKTHGGLDLDEFYEEHAESEVTDIIVEYTKMLLAAVKDEENKNKLDELAKKLTPAKSSRKKKDPDAPKRGKSAYIFFGQEHRAKATAELMEEHGEDYKHTMVMSKLGVMWNELKASTKAKDKKAVEKFEKMAADDKERYDAEMADYTPSTDDEEPAKKVAKKPSPKKEVAKKPSPKKEVAKKPSPKKDGVVDKAGFRLWKEESEEEIKGDFPKLTPGKFLNKCIELWEELDDKERQEWADEEAKQDYTGEEEDEEGDGEGEVEEEDGDY